MTLKEIINCIAKSIRADILEEIKECCVVGIQIDELSDITSCKVLTVNVKYTLTGAPASQFLALIELDKSDGENIYKHLSLILKEFGIFDKLKSICSDGAPALTLKKKEL